MLSKYLTLGSLSTTSNFNISSYVSFSHSGIRPTALKLKHNISHTNKQRHFYFNHICRLCNSLPIINLTFNINNQLRKFSGNTSLKISMLPILISYTLSLPLQLVHQQLPHKLRSSLVRIMNSQ